MSGSWDLREFDTLAADLHQVSESVAPAVKAVVKKGAVAVKTRWRDGAVASSGKAARVYPYSIGFDLDADGLGATIGPDKAKTQGALGNLLEFGSTNNHPYNDGGRALEVEGPAFQKYLEQVTGEVLAKIGLE